MSKKNKKTDKKSFWKILSEKRGLTAVIAALAVVLLVAVVVVVSLNTSNKKPPKGPSVAVAEDFYHTTPKDLDAKNAINLVNNTTAKRILQAEGGYSFTAEPVPHEKGWCVYDEDGWVRRYRDENGKVHDLPKDEWFEDIMYPGGNALQIIGDLRLNFVVYKNEGVVERCYRYYVLSDKADMEFLLSALTRCGFENIKQESGLVVSVVLDEDAIYEELMQVQSENIVPDVSVENYVNYLTQRYALEIAE